MPPVINVPQQSALDIQFEILAEEWKSATTLLSSTTAMVSHPTYRAIIDLGPDVVPLLLRDLQREPAHWFEALRALTGEDPVPSEHWGDVLAMREDWLSWGRQHELI
jgi:hypothetical protein